ncbi:MAG: hypothetical protein ACUVV0_05305, partial [Anaerolineae bacterium]
MSEIPKEMLEEGLGLLELSQDDLFTALGAQARPDKAARLTRSARKAASLSESAFRDVRALDSYRREVEEEARNVGAATEELASEGKSFFEHFEEELRKAICTPEGTCREEIEKLMGDAESLLGKLIPIVVATLNLPAILSSIAVTIAVILMKTGLQTWCKMG